MSNKRKTEEVPLTVTRPELLVNNSDGEFRNLINHLLAFSGLLETIRNGFAEYIGLSGIQYTILVCIAHLDEQHKGVSIKSIANHLALSGAFITIETGKLDGQGLVRKVKNPEDGRGVLVQVTKDGNRLLSKLAPIQQNTNDKLFSSLNKDDFMYLNKLVDSMVIDAQDASALLSYLVTADRSNYRK